MTQRLLFVCHANVCRSPVMMWTMTKALQERDLRVSSAGVQAARQGLLCDVARDVLGDAVPAKNGRKAASITRSMIDAADLIITATKGERSTLALLSPGIRSRVFTLREAVLLGERGEVGSDDWLGEGGLGAYAAVLHRRRGLLTLPKPQRFRVLRQTDPLDHADVHQARRRLHRSGLHAVQADTLRLAAQLSGPAHASAQER